MEKIGKTIAETFKLTKHKSYTIDNLVFKLHYRFTCWLLIAFCGIICIEEYNKQKMKCTHSDPTDSKKQLEHVIATYCFFMTTFTVPRHHNMSSGNMAYSGVGPAGKDEETVRHTYYQWVPYVLALQAVSFYIPHFLWRVKEGGRLGEIVSQFTFEQLCEDVKDNKEIRRSEAMNYFFRSFAIRLKMYRSWLRWLVTCEVLNLLNVILQVYLTDLFLGGNFFQLGSLVYSYYGSEEYSPFDAIFPKVSKCTFQKYGPAGSLQTHDAVCILSLNIINEKMYLVLWYWYIIVFAASVLMLIHRIFSYLLYATGVSYNMSVFQKEMLTLKPPRSDLEKIMNKYDYSEWFFLQTLATNLDGELAVDLLKEIADAKIPSKYATSSTESTPESSPVGIRRRNLPEQVPLFETNKEKGVQNLA